MFGSILIPLFLLALLNGRSEIINQSIWVGRDIAAKSRALDKPGFSLLYSCISPSLTEYLE